MRHIKPTGFPTSLSRLVLGLFLGISLLGACREPDAFTGAFPDLSAIGDLGKQSDAGTQDGAVLRDLGPTPDLSWPAPMPPPSSCYQRSADVTGIQVVVRVDQYIGLQTGRNGTHEIVHATIINTPWVYKASIVDTTNVELAMNVSSTGNPAGLPKEIPVRPRDQFEVEGEYIPKSKASATTALGPAAVIHFTHTPCGYAVLGGTLYR